METTTVYTNVHVGEGRPVFTTFRNYPQEESCIHKAYVSVGIEGVTLYLTPAQLNDLTEKLVAFRDTVLEKVEA